MQPKSEKSGRKKDSTAAKNAGTGNSAGKQTGSAEPVKKNDIITLMDEKGNQSDFEFLDLIDYSAKQYAVLIPTDEAADQVVIFEVEDADSEDNVFIPVKDMDLAMAVFGLFRDRNKDYYDFT